MNCKNCGKELVKYGSMYWCAEDQQLYKIDGDTQRIVKDKEKGFNELKAKYSRIGEGLKSLGEKLGFAPKSKEERDEDDEDWF